MKVNDDMRREKREREGEGEREMWNIHNSVENKEIPNINEGPIHRGENHFQQLIF